MALPCTTLVKDHNQENLSISGAGIKKLLSTRSVYGFTTARHGTKWFLGDLNISCLGLN